MSIDVPCRKHRPGVSALVVAGAGLALAGCQSFGRAPEPVAPDTAEKAVFSTPSDRGDVPGLPAQDLAAGECGLFLWTRRDDPAFVFFSKSNDPAAMVWYEDNAQNLTLAGVDGEVFDQEYTNQTFTFEGKTSLLRLSLTPGQKLVDGRRVPEASIRIIDAEGWETVIPAVGITACRPRG